MNCFESLAMWYLRLNGYFVMPNFIAHGQPGVRTEVDVLAVRFPHSKEYGDDMQMLKIPTEKVDVVLAESKPDRCSLNGPWKESGDNQALEYVLRRVGIFESDSGIKAAADGLYGKQRYEVGIYTVRVVCFGRKQNGSLPNVTQILWPHVLDFIHRRFVTYRDDKADHQHWDQFGKYLWEALARNGVPDVTQIVQGWKDQCCCWP